MINLVSDVAMMLSVTAVTVVLALCVVQIIGDLTHDLREYIKENSKGDKNEKD